ncbi:MAG: glycosyltransferase family 4 protein [Candidatus Moranbacteria bacterium CG_4_10_14_3_um_filter_44_15]|nr:MAG: glycosyltransferase family 4 protein [Candidatus Moranbacteria bacterium CG06_land_8_20_14_3_00_43_56]PIV83936.1 MAG: glycosyltransferase family 4 protein [Candidatus Moranbacteria bacterium CG17_big_fil_post_rev_8_21_14_2_50_44_12]PIW93199.1 MAG: glycosyltransferase family 4 protein [Candidatus Moranbacteria bacterium CG_4_8_14_3_um_filter_43_15]PIX90626.1 MAG: glycosyltransferase family 4 protein [Candidatus Moranbacteria bacterium CG_4_10_14_3_um_filter_44_15]PJA85521.1 MAG: glycosyl
MKIALVHDYLVQYGGAERVLECFTEIWPYAPIYTLIYDEEKTHGIFKGKRICTSFLQNFPYSHKNHRIFPPLMPPAIEQFDFSKYDIVLSDSSSYAKGVITPPNVLHLCYCHTPMRYAWDDCQKYIEEFGFPKFVKKLVPFFMNYIRVWDRISAERPDEYVANSNFVAGRIKKYYKKNSIVINPPVDVNKFRIGEKTADYFLMVGRLMTYKRFDIVIEAFNELSWPLKIIGRGPDMKRLSKMAKPNIIFTGRLSEEELARTYSEAKAFVFPQEEDFGIVAIEAMVAGKPIISFRGGDIVEHVREGIEGIFFDEQTSDSLVDALKKFDSQKFDPQKIRERALPFDREIFKGRIKDYVENSLQRHFVKN